MKRHAAFATTILLLAFGVACNNNDNNPLPTAPEQPEPVPTTTETFMGGLALGGTSCHTFDVMQPGPVTMSITALAPLETLTLGMGIGLPDAEANGGCGLLVFDNTVRKDESFLATVNTLGDHCVCVFDVGNIFANQNVTYTLDVDHP